MVEAAKLLGQSKSWSNLKQDEVESALNLLKLREVTFPTDVKVKVVAFKSSLTLQQAWATTDMAEQKQKVENFVLSHFLYNVVDEGAGEFKIEQPCFNAMMAESLLQVAQAESAGYVLCELLSSDGDAAGKETAQERSKPPSVDMEAWTLGENSEWVGSE